MHLIKYKVSGDKTYQVLCPTWKDSRWTNGGLGSSSSVLDMDLNNSLSVSLESLETELKTLRHDVNDMFLVFSAIITSFMQVGFASLEAGFVNSKNVTNIILKNVLDTFICAIAYWLLGFSLAYTAGNAIIGYSGFAGTGIGPDLYSFWVFEFVFASTASTILSGSVAERCSFVTYMAYSSIISGFVYPVASHWAWAEQGWLKNLGYMDLGGSGVVHALGGTCALVAAIFLGPRIGRFHNGKPVDMPGHSMSLVGLGGLILISGFIGFNIGSLGRVSGQGAQLGLVTENTVMGGAGAAVMAMLLCRTGAVGEPKWAFAITLNAAIAGIVSICGGVNLYAPVMALVTGACSCLVFLLVRWLVLRLQIDDPLDCVAVHLGGGFTGVITGPLFTPKGILFGVNEASVQQLWHNLVGISAILVWSAACSILLFGTLWLFGQLRVSEEEEIEGLDKSKHNEPAYPVGGWASHYPIQIQQSNGIKKTGSYTLNRSSNGELVMVGPQLMVLTVDEHTV